MCEKRGGSCSKENVKKSENGRKENDEKKKEGREGKMVSCRRKERVCVEGEGEEK